MGATESTPAGPASLPEDAAARKTMKISHEAKVKCYTFLFLTLHFTDRQGVRCIEARFAAVCWSALNAL